MMNNREHAAINGKQDDVMIDANARTHFTLNVPAITAHCYSGFQQLHSIEMTEKQFVGLCAYLYTLLKWGYTIHVGQLDSFITYHETFIAWLPYLEERQISSICPQIPSYHQWFNQEMDRINKLELRQEEEEEDEDTQVILTESTLREIRKENPLIFLRTSLSLECMVIDTQREANKATMIQLLRS